MSDAARNVKAIFWEALDCATPAEQAAYLDRACGDDTALRGRVEALLRAHLRTGQFLQGKALADRDASEAAATVLGPYRLLEPLGEGGFGIVYRAEQQQPVRRRVALKVLRPGMGNREVIARFEAERQALALMDHPNIARVLDAGEAPPAYAGGPPRPYFVMELVEGVPLTEFCDHSRLAPRERLGLFLSVCQAVQHAHQKGIIHRDLKPSNVLVARADGVPVVKVIDFGIAKALEQRLTDKTLVTGAEQVVGTPLYMSPEQAAPGAVDIDTRSDIYSLGVVLYELLTGTTPFEWDRLRQAPFGEMLRIIREEEPPRPSARVSTLGPALTLAEQRGTAPGQLAQLLRGELDWIVMKCLEKERGRRYQTADALARDVGRYLADEPVEACPPSASYRLGKFLRKHRRPLLTAAAFLGLLLAGGVLAGRQAVREARAQRDRAVEQAKRGAAVRDALDQVRALREEARKAPDAGKWARARAQAQRAQALVESGPTEEDLAAQVRLVQEELEEEEKDRRLVADLEAARIAQVEKVAGQNRFAAERAIPRFRKAFHAYGLPAGVGDPATAAARLRLRPPAVRQAVSAALDEWLDLAADPARRVHEPHLGWLRALAAAELDGGGMRELRAAAQEPDPARRRAALKELAAAADVRRVPLGGLVRLARRLHAARATPSAVQLLRRAWREHPADFWVNEELGSLLGQMEPPRWEEAVRHLTAGVALRPGSPGAHHNLALALQEGGQWDDAIACDQKAIALDRDYALAHSSLGAALGQKGQWDRAIASCKKALELDPKHGLSHYSLGVALVGKGKVEEAIACYQKAIELNPRFATAHVSLGALLCDVKRDYDGAIACFRQALELEPENANAHYNLGNALDGKGKAEEAIACFKKAIKLNPKIAGAHVNLGAILCDVKRDYDGAIACYQKALELEPKSASFHLNLGSALWHKGKAEEASECFRQAIVLDPKLAGAHTNLGSALYVKGKVEEALACYHKALELDPKDASARRNLGVIHNDKGNAYTGQGKLDEALASFKKAIEFEPTYAEAHCNLAIVLQGQGRFAESLAAFQRGHQLGTKQPGWNRPSAQWVRQARRLAALEVKLPAVLKGEVQPRDAAERLGLAGVSHAKKLHHAATRLYTDAFAAEPKLADGQGGAHRYHAACAAALAAAGQGEDASKLDAGQRARLRQRALDWLRADLALRGKQLDSGQGADRADVQLKLRFWQNDRALAGIRDRAALAKLPAQEQKAFAQLWSDVAALLAKTAAAPKK